MGVQFDRQPELNAGIVKPNPLFAKLPHEYDRPLAQSIETYLQHWSYPVQQFLLESPLSVGLCGGLVVVALLVWWTQSGSRWAAVLAVCAALLSTLLVIVSLKIETDREQIRRTIDEVAEALANNNVPLVISYIHADAAAGLQRASQELPQYTFREARVTRLKGIEVNPRVIPPAAIAELNVAVEIEAGGQKIPIRRFVKVYFVKHEQRWLVRDYEHFDALAGLDAGR